MHRTRDFLVLFAVAAAVPGATAVLGQDPKAAAPQPAKEEPKPAPNVTITIFSVTKPAAPAEPQAAKEAVKVKEAIPAKPAVRAKGAAAARAAPAAKVVRREPMRVMLPAVGVQGGGLDAAAIDAQAAQYVQQFRPIARAEYYFLKNLCEPSAEQRKRLAEVCEAATLGAARAFVVAQNQMMRGGMRDGVTYPDARKLVEEEFVKSIGFLSEAQRATYKRECELREAARKQVFIDNLAAKLESDLVLSPQQRDQVAAALASNWKDAWGQSLDMLQNIEHFFPNVPDEVVLPILTDKQKAVWRRIPKNQGVFFGLGGMMAFMDPDPLDDPELVEARKAAELKEKPNP